MKVNIANMVWRELVETLIVRPDYLVSPRGMKCSEILAAGYAVPMPAYLDLEARHVNISFMFAEAAWILSGRNDLAYIKQYLPGYAEFSDDGVFMKGAYGPKVADQLPYIVQTLIEDSESRQAVLTIWRERPGPSKDIPCTIAMQFLIRNGQLHAFVTMRSQDVVLGYTYDIFTFSMISKAIQLMLQSQGIETELGMLHMNVGSLHLYDSYSERAERWSTTEDRVEKIGKEVDKILNTSDDITTLINQLIRGAGSNVKKSL